jgi:hypothetical protein
MAFARRRRHPCSSAFESRSYWPLARTSPVVEQRLQELHSVGLQFGEFITNEFLWEWAGPKMNCTKHVFAASFAAPHIMVTETVMVANGVSQSQSVTVTLKNRTHRVAARAMPGADHKVGEHLRRLYVPNTNRVPDTLHMFDRLAIQRSVHWVYNFRQCDHTFTPLLPL